MNNVTDVASLVLRDGWSLSGQALTTTADTDDRLVLADSALGLGDIGDATNPNGIIGFDHLVKTGTGTATLTGAQTAGNFHSGVVETGTLIMDSASLGLINITDLLTVRRGAVLAVNGTSTVNGSLNNTGTVSMQNGVAGDALVVTGNYTAASELALDTVLEDDGSASDVLDVRGDTSGATNVNINNIGGGGAQTVNGIPVVLVGGNSAGDFILSNGDFVTPTGDPALIAGAYAYTLQKETGGDWVLSSKVTAVTPPEPTTPVTPPEPTTPVTPTEHMFQPGAPVYEAYPRSLQVLNGLPGLVDRVGVRHEALISAAENGGSLGRSWARIEGGTLDIAGSSTTSSETSYDHVRLRFGVDYLLSDTTQGDFVLGANGYIGRVDTDITSRWGNGGIETKGYGVAVTGTWYAASGLYTDLQAQYSRFDSDLSSQTLGVLSSGIDGEGYALSAEIGQEFSNVSGSGWNLAPQGQLTWSAVDFDDFTGPKGEKIALDSGDSLRLRLGVAADKDFAGADGSNTRVYGEANLYHEFGDTPAVLVDGVKLAGTTDDDWVEITLGVDHSFGTKGNASVYGEISYAAGLSNPRDQSAARASLGVKMGW